MPLKLIYIYIYIYIERERERGILTSTMLNAKRTKNLSEKVKIRHQIVPTKLKKIDINCKKKTNFAKKSKKKKLWLIGTAKCLLTQPIYMCVCLHLN